MDTIKNVIRVGVLGGIGPESTAVFYTKLIIQLQAKGMIKSNSDFPQIVINSIPAKELVYERIEDKDLAMYIEGLKQLDEFGVDFIVMVCNTIHLFYEKLQSGVKTPILDLRKEVRSAIGSTNAKSVLVLGTPNTLDKELYGLSFATAKPIKPSNGETKILAEAIFNFNNGTDKIGQAETVHKICESYLDSGKADMVLLGCTEFGLMLDDSKFPKINTIDVLVNATINRLRDM